jgi:hypothetical protein
VTHPFAPAPAPWQEVLHLKDGQPVARLLRSGTEVHFEVASGHEHKVIYRHVTRNFLRPVFDEFGLLTTKTERDDEVNKRFITRLGFRHSWSDADYDYYMLTALPFGKKGN